MSLKFPKQQRLSSRKAIQQLFKSGKRFSSYPFNCIYVIREASEDEFGVQAGFSVAKRNIKLAVHRNRIKRQMREAYRLHKSGLHAFCVAHKIQLHVFFIYNCREQNQFDIFESKISALVERLHQQLVHYDEKNQKE